MGPVSLPTSDRHELTGALLSTINYHPVPPRIPGAPFCLGETPDLRGTLFNKLDLRYSFHRIVKTEYGGQKELHQAALNYRVNRTLDTSITDRQYKIPYEKALRNLVVLMFGHYIDAFECHSSRFGHRTILAWECLQVAKGLGRYHRFIKRGETRDWTAKLPVANDDPRWKFSTAMSLLGDARDPTFAHPLALAQYFDQVYHQGRFPGELPMRRPGQAKEITQEVYDREVDEICARLRTFDDPGFRNCRILPPTSLRNPEIILEPEEYRQITDMKTEIANDRILPKVAEFKVDGAEARLDLAPGVPLPDRPREDPDDTDYESLYGVYYDDDGNRIPEYVDDEDVPALEDAMSGCDTPMTGVSTDTEQAGHMDQLSLTSPYHPSAPNPRDLKVQVATSSAGSIRKVRQVAPLPPKFDQFNVKQLVSEVSRQVTQSVVDQLTGLSPADAQADLNIRQALAATRREESAATPVQPDSIPAILRAMRTGGEGARTPVKAVAAVCGQPAVPHGPQHEPEPVHRARRPGRWNRDPLGLQADINAQLQQQRERGRERRPGSAKRRSSSRSRDDVKRGRQTPSSDESSEPAIDWAKNTIGPATWESAGPRAPKSPARTSRLPSSTRGSNQPAAASRHSQSRPKDKEKDDEAAKKARAQEAKKQQEDNIIKNFPATYISARISEMRADRFVTEARSLRFYKGVAMTRTKEIIALADWGYQFGLISHSPCPDIPGFLQQSCFGSRNAVHDVPQPPLRIMLETADVRKKCRMLWVHLCCLLQFWTDEAGYLEGNAFYGGLVREQSYLVQYVMMRMNNQTRGETVVTWRDVVRGTPWLKKREEFSATQEAALRLQPAPDRPNELEKEMEAWWQIVVMRKKCAASVATAPSTTAPPDAPPNTPASTSGASSAPELDSSQPAAACSRPPPGIHPAPTNQFVPDSSWHKLPNPRDNPAPAGKYRTPFDELDVELGRSSLVETPLSQFETEEAIGDLLKQCPDLTGGPLADVEMAEQERAQTPNPTRLLSSTPAQFQPEIGDTEGYNYDLLSLGSGMSAAPSSPVTADDDELLDLMTNSTVEYSRVVGTGRPKSTTPQKKDSKGPEESK